MASNRHGNKKSSLVRLEAVGDQLKSQVDSFRNDSLISIKEAATREEEEAIIKDLLKKYISLTSSVEEAMEKISSLKRDDGKVRMTDFNKRKSQEINRLQNLQEQLDEIADKIDPEESERSFQNLSMDDSLDDDYEESPGKDSRSKVPKRKGDYQNQDNTSEDEDDDFDEEEDDIDEEEEEEEDQDQEDDEEGEDMSVPRYVEAICDFEGEEPGDLEFVAGEVLTIISTREDGWWEAENRSGDRGLVPTTYLKEIDNENDDSFEKQVEEEDGRPSPSGKELWAKVREAASISQEITPVSKALSALGAMPSCFRETTLGRLAAKGGVHNLQLYLSPRLSESNLSYRDLQWNSKSNTIEPYNCKVTRLFNLVTAKHAPLPGAGVNVLSRHVRIAFSNRAKILSNVHTVRAVCLKDNLVTWKFSPVVKGTLPSLFDGNSVARIDFTDSSLGNDLIILIFLAYSFLMFHSICLSARTYELKLQGGSIYEPGVEIDNSQKSGKRGQNPFSSKKHPRLLVRLINPKRADLEILDFLPNTIITCQSYAPFIKYYREILGKVILHDSPDEQSTDLIHHPVLASFSKVIQHTDLMDALKTCWEDNIKSATRSERKDRDFMRNFFIKIFMRSAYPLLHSAELQPAAPLADNDVYQARYAVIENFLKQSNILSNLLSPNVIHNPFDSSEMSYDITGASTNLLH
ncbi:uncharacterized protein TRIADDRAFT_54526 [Trichoplax adhaerens]|uniref:SH3 domain-containing protein n=1 Tax=Trichoplax adhaerens TaxID=10228 RepID=B3RSA3_TRIAD|nr:hypothetical protein TRIADDRAFT_54526 [Trichoplax adhaerens]EDV26480.1 hypothetical protein TRIADDRAFT_54526 [Trichoplax adhaerens]|eukprot:XP_002110476.1 hypothetical protein TRIADDRAFT_54526 [Trichoplax adhaerens]